MRGWAPPDHPPRRVLRRKPSFDAPRRLLHRDDEKPRSQGRTSHYTLASLEPDADDEKSGHGRCGRSGGLCCIICLGTSRLQRADWIDLTECTGQVGRMQGPKGEAHRPRRSGDSGAFAEPRGWADDAREVCAVRCSKTVNGSFSYKGGNDERWDLLGVWLVCMLYIVAGSRRGNGGTRRWVAGRGRSTMFCTE